MSVTVRRQSTIMDFFETTYAAAGIKLEPLLPDEEPWERGGDSMSVAFDAVDTSEFDIDPSAIEPFDPARTNAALHAAALMLGEDPNRQPYLTISLHCDPRSIDSL